MRQAVKSAGPRILRCAIYTRKSTDHNLDLEFNSLQAQREACEAYIKSQAHEGWRLVPDRFDDGAFSGASLDRPALRALMACIRAHQVDVIVVYKVDRLTRSLADFAKLVELFDANDSSFVSVTQSFNTTSSMGRLTLNVLLSFAQFEREVIGERVRDKIAASKKKGLWVGGPVPLGYACVEKKLIIVPQEAETIRLIFVLYLELGSVRLLTQELRRRGIITKRQILANGLARGGGPFSVGALHHLLRNRFYIGEVCYRGGIYPGEHQPILDRPLFEDVQKKLADRAVARKVKRSSSPAILTSLIFDDQGNRMTPSHARKKGVRYRYYVSQALLQGRADTAGSVARISASEIENVVSEGLRRHLVGTLSRAGAGSPEYRELIESHIERIIIRRETIEIWLKDGDRTASLEGAANHASLTSRKPVTLRLPWAAPVPAAIKGILTEPKVNNTSPAMRHMLLTAIAKARSWIDDLASGRAASFAEIAEREGKVERHIRFLAPLAFVPPALVASIANDDPPVDVTVTKLARALPLSWGEKIQMHH